MIVLLYWIFNKSRYNKCSNNGPHIWKIQNSIKSSDIQAVYTATLFSIKKVGVVTRFCKSCGLAVRDMHISIEQWMQRPNITSSWLILLYTCLFRISRLKKIRWGIFHFRQFTCLQEISCIFRSPQKTTIVSINVLYYRPLTPLLQYRTFIKKLVNMK